MFKKFLFVLITLMLLFVVACKNVDTNDLVLECDDVMVMVGQSIVIEPNTNKKKANFNLTSDSELIKISGTTIEGLEKGQAYVLVNLDGTDLTKKIKVVVYGEGLTIIGNNEVVINEKETLDLIKIDVDEDERITWRSSNENIATCIRGIVTGKDYGKVTITAKSDIYSATFEIEVVRPIPTEMIIENNKKVVKFEVGSTYDLEKEFVPSHAKFDIKLETESDVISIEDGKVIANKLGEGKLTVTSLANPSLVKEIDIEVVNQEKPKFETLSNYEDVLVVNYGDSTNLSKGLKAIDNADGDITDRISCDSEVLTTYGEKEVILTVKDRAGNEETFKRKINVTWQYNTMFIGHMGCIYGVPNSESAFVYAAKELKYQALECDLNRTKDGVFVISHDAAFKDVDIATHTYDELKDLIKTSTPFALPKQYGLAELSYSDKICTLERYLEICKEYGVIAVIELKGTSGINNSDQSGMPALMKVLEDNDMLDQTILLSSSYNCLIWAREHGYTLPCQYLVSTCDSDTVYQRCVDYNLDISICVTYGNYTDKMNPEQRLEYKNTWLKKYHDAGLKISVYTFTSYSDYNTVQEWIDFGVDFVTCDWHHMDQLNLK